MTEDPVDGTTSISALGAKEVASLFDSILAGVREEIRDSLYLQEARRVSYVSAYRSVIGSVWNAVVDDLRNKIIDRRLYFFNRSMSIKPDLSTYEDFQSRVSDDCLLNGAYRTGIIGWEAHKMLSHAKEAQHIFYGHPKSADPSPFVVLSVVENCVKYVLAEPYPSEIVDLDEYLVQMGRDDYDRNEMAVRDTVSDLPDPHRGKMAHMLFSHYVSGESSSILRSNIEWCASIVWGFLARDTKRQLMHRVEKEIKRASGSRIALAFAFADHVAGHRFLPAAARTYKLKPLIERLESGLVGWDVEYSVIAELELYSEYVPDDLIERCVKSLVENFAAYSGGNRRYYRKPLPMDAGVNRIPKLFGTFDDRAVAAFVTALRGNTKLKSIVTGGGRIDRLRRLGEIAAARASANLPDKRILDLLLDQKREDEFLSFLGGECEPQQPQAQH